MKLRFFVRAFGIPHFAFRIPHWLVLALSVFLFIPHAMGQRSLVKLKTAPNSYGHPVRIISGQSSSLAAFIRSHYVKHDYNIPMRDGVHLFTSVYAPRDTNREYGIMMVRTPYSIRPYGETNYPGGLGPSEAFARHGFIFVYQDVRGRNHSEGDYIDMPPHKRHFSGPTDTDETTDAADSINWLVQHIPNNNGRVGLWGISYPGFYAAQAMIDASPALKADSPQAPMGDEGNGDDIYHNGAFFLAANLGFYSGFWPRGVNVRFDYGTPDQYEFYLRMGPLANAQDICFKHQNPYWDDVLKHPNYDWFWSSRALGPVMTNLIAPVLIVGGWFDTEDLGGTLKLFQAIRGHGGAPAALVMGPWSHGEWGHPGGESLGDLQFGSRTSDFFESNIQYPFFLDALEPSPTNETQLPVAWMFETGNNEWRKFNSWPPADAVQRSLYLHADGKLSFQPPSGRQKFDEYVSDPAKPVPVTSEIGDGMPGDYMTRDQRFASRRTDVLSWESEPLTGDVVVAGPITPVLRVSTSGTDSDFVVKLIDVYPDDTPDSGNVHFGGYQQMVRGEPFRGKFRNSMSDPEPFVPNKPAKIEFAMPDVLHDFCKGHRMMVQIQSSWFPMVDMNPQRFENIPTAKASDFQKATERVYCGGRDGTRIELLTIQ
ncbi:MAG TPA: CocE/NonD family hydrolase [Candidatus Sulfotelmatobacter sp.]|nr:CocE/NonD family hydrolase [Candidatus Sulfotelmatobacter sp.]